MSEVSTLMRGRGLEGWDGMGWEGRKGYALPWLYTFLTFIYLLIITFYSI